MNVVPRQPQKYHRYRHSARRGYTFIELAITIMIIGILVTFALTTFGNTSESRDATMVQAAQATLQSVVSQGSARMDLPPTSLNTDSVLNALKASFSTTAGSSDVQFSRSGSSFVMTIPNGGRTATFIIGTNGDVTLSSLSNFTTYQVQNGIIKKI